MEKVAEARFHGFEFGDWRKADAAIITPLKNKLGLECACIVGNKTVNPKGMTLTDPKDRPAFLAEIRASVEAAKRFETRRMVTLTGNEAPVGFKTKEQGMTLVRVNEAGVETPATIAVTV